MSKAKKTVKNKVSNEKVEVFVEKHTDDVIVAVENNIPLIEVSSPIEVPPPRVEKKLFHSLEEDRIKLEEAERKKREEIRLKQESEKKSDKPYLQCNFCQNIQYNNNSKDPTSAWCTKCGRCFMVDWK